MNVCPILCLLEYIAELQFPNRIDSSIGQKEAKQYLNFQNKLSIVIFRLSPNKLDGLRSPVRRPEFFIDSRLKVNGVLTTREFAAPLKRKGIGLPDLEPGQFAPPFMSEGTGAAEIFGSTGGVMETAVRTGHAVGADKELPGVALKAGRGLEGIREASVVPSELGTVNATIANSLKSARELME